MGKKDVIMTEYYGDKARYADFINVCVFHGKQIVMPDDIYEKDSRVTGILGKIKNRVLIQKYRDMIRRIVLGTNIVLVALENQDQIHYAMPVRVMLDDAAGYDEQMRKIQRWHNRRHDLNGAEFLGRFAKEDKLEPILTFVLYYGKEPWTGPKDLHQMMNMDTLPEEMKRLVNNYPIRVIEMRNFADVELFQTDLREVFGFFQRSEDKEAVGRFVEERKEQFERLAEDAYDMITVLTNTREFMENKEENREEGGKINMCRAIKEMIEDGRAEGRAEGNLEAANRINELNLRLLEDGRQDDMIRAMKDLKYQERLLKEYQL